MRVVPIEDVIDFPRKYMCLSSKNMLSTRGLESLQQVQKQSSLNPYFDVS